MVETLTGGMPDPDLVGTKLSKDEIKKTPSKMVKAQCHLQGLLQMMPS